jgi:hypothetical protein
MSALQTGDAVQIHVRGRNYTAEIVSLSRSRATVAYTDVFGENRVAKLPLTAVVEIEEVA